MITEPITVFEKWYCYSKIEEKLETPIYRNIMNVDRTLLISSCIYDALVIPDRRLDQLVNPQIGAFRVKVLQLERDPILQKNYVYLELTLETVKTKHSPNSKKKVEIRLGESLIYTLDEFIDGSTLSSYNLPPLILFQVKEISLIKGCVKIGPVLTVEI